MRAIPADITPAELRWWRPTLAAHAVYEFMRDADPMRAPEVLAAAPALTAKREAELRALAAELASLWGLAGVLAEAVGRPTDGALDAWVVRTSDDAGPNGEDPLWNGPGYEEWMALARRAEVHVASLVVDAYLADEERAEMRVPGLPVEFIERPPAGVAG